MTMEAGQAAPEGQAAPAVAEGSASATASTATVDTTVSATPTPAAWTESLSPDMQNYVTNKGFKDPASVLDSYVNLEKLRGVPDDRLLKLPENMSDAEAMKDVYRKLGTPDNAADYGIAIDSPADPEFSGFLSETFKNAGLSKAQSDKIVESLNGRTEETRARVDGEYEQKIQKQELDLKKEWGQAYHQNIAKAQHAAREFGVDAEAIDALEGVMGYDGVMRFMSNIGSKLGEDSFVQGMQQSLNGKMTPDQAKSRIQALRGDGEFTKRYLSGDIGAREEMENLHKMANPGS